MVGEGVALIGSKLPSRIETQMHRWTPLKWLPNAWVMGRCYVAVTACMWLVQNSHINTFAEALSNIVRLLRQAFWDSHASWCCVRHEVYRVAGDFTCLIEWVQNFACCIVCMNYRMLGCGLNVQRALCDSNRHLLTIIGLLTLKCFISHLWLVEYGAICSWAYGRTEHNWKLEPGNSLRGCLGTSNCWMDGATMNEELKDELMIDDTRMEAGGALKTPNKCPSSGKESPIAGGPTALHE